MATPCGFEFGRAAQGVGRHLHQGMEPRAYSLVERLSTAASFGQFMRFECDTMQGVVGDLAALEAAVTESNVQGGKLDEGADRVGMP